MTDVVSIKFKNRGKAYFFDPAGLDLQVGDSVIVDTANGMELAVCSRENHPVEDSAVVQPLRRVLRKATQMDLRAEELARQKEKNAMAVCREKIAEHGLNMKLVDVECNFEGSKTTFFFTSDERVDFRALVKDLAGILHNRIELRQIGVRDEAKLLGGLGICGRPYCCNLYMDDFHPVSTKMAKIQSLSLNPAKISGSCGRLMCCLRYEQEAYEDLVKKVPKQGAFVETKDGYGTAVSVNLLRSTVRVRLDDDREDVLHEYRDYELAAVPGGRPKDGSEPPHVLNYVEAEHPAAAEEPEDEWAVPEAVAEESAAAAPPSAPDADVAVAGEGSRRKRRSRSKRKAGGVSAGKAVKADPEKPENSASAPRAKIRVEEESAAPEAQGAAAAQSGAERARGKRKNRSRGKKAAAQTGAPEKGAVKSQTVPLKVQKVPVQQDASAAAGAAGEKKKRSRRPFRSKPKQNPPAQNS